VNWRNIASAPTDGRPVWVRGYDYGDNTKAQHYTWAYWNGTEWRSASHRGESSTLLYLTGWYDAEAQQ